MDQRYCPVLTVATKKIKEEGELQDSKQKVQHPLEGVQDSESEQGEGDTDRSQEQQAGKIHFLRVMAMLKVNPRPVPHFDTSGDLNSLCQKGENFRATYQ